MNNDLTAGKPDKVLRRFCLPLFGSIIFQQLYNIADSLAAGKFIGENALAAVGNSYEITLIFIAFAFGCNIGCSVTVSHLFGAKEYQKLKTAVSTACIFSGVICAALMVLGLSGGGCLLRMISTPDGLFSDSKLYLDIYIFGLPFVFFYNIANGIFCALGDSKTPFYFLAISSSSNIAVDILFVKAFGMGVAGVAWATFLCQGISCTAAVVTVFLRLKKIPHCGAFRFFDMQLLKKISAVAVPSIFQQSFISVGNIVIQSVINSFGASVMAGYSAAVKLNNMVMTSFTTVGNGISNFSAQNLGAGKYGRIGKGFYSGVKMIWILCVPFFISYMFFAKYLLLLFMQKNSGNALAVGVQFLQILSPFYFVASIKLVADGILRGIGAMRQFMLSTFIDLTLRAALAFILSDLMKSSTGIWLAWPFGWITAAAFSVFFYRAEYKKLK